MPTSTWSEQARWRLKDVYIFGLNIARLRHAGSKALEVTAHNIANANTPSQPAGCHMSPTSAAYTQKGCWAAALVDQITASVTGFSSSRSCGSTLGRWEARTYLSQIRQIFRACRKRLQCRLDPFDTGRISLSPESSSPAPHCWKSRSRPMLSNRQHILYCT